jgi:hypothetical protein
MVLQIINTAVQITTIPMNRTAEGLAFVPAHLLVLMSHTRQKVIKDKEQIRSLVQNVNLKT